MSSLTAAVRSLSDYPRHGSSSSSIGPPSSPDTTSWVSVGSPTKISGPEVPQSDSTTDIANVSTDDFAFIVPSKSMSLHHLANWNDPCKPSSSSNAKSQDTPRSVSRDRRSSSPQRNDYGRFKDRREARWARNRNALNLAAWRNKTSTRLNEVMERTALQQVLLARRKDRRSVIDPKTLFKNPGLPNPSVWTEPKTAKALSTVITPGPQEI